MYGSQTRSLYLAIVGDWTGGDRGLCGQAFPLVDVTTGRAVTSPRTEFPKNGCLFLPNRAGLATWQLVLVSPESNANTDDSSWTYCRYVATTARVRPVPPVGGPPAAVVLDHAGFEPSPGAEVVVPPRTGVTPVVYVRDEDSVFGPFLAERLRGGGDAARLVPLRGDSLVYRFDASALGAAGLTPARWSFEEGGSEDPQMSAPGAHSFLLGPVQTATSTEPVDLSPDDEIVEWFAGLIDAKGGAEARALASLTDAAHRLADDDARFAPRRRRVLGLLGSAARLRDATRSLLDEWLRSEAGARRVEERLDAEVRARRDDLVRRAAEAETAQAARLAALDREAEAHAAEADKALERVRAETARLEEKRAAASAAADRLAALASENAATLASRVAEIAPFVASAPPSPVSDPRSRTTAAPVRPSVERPVPRAAEAPSSPDEYVDALRDYLTAATGVGPSRPFTANLIASVAASPLLLLAGPPGHGKSALGSAACAAIGDTTSTLSVGVRRGWADDSALLGAYVAGAASYDPGPSGVVPWLVRAGRAAASGSDTFHFCVIDGFAAAQPEFYFSEILAALPAPVGRGVLRLYDDGLPCLAGDVPPSVTVPWNVRFVGIVSDDGTAARPGAALLDRAAVVRIGGSDVVSSGAAVSAPRPPALPVTRFGPDSRPSDEAVRLVRGVTDRLAEEHSLPASQRPSPLGGRHVLRYLSAAASLLHPVEAADFAVEQYVLPKLRGYGESFAAVLGGLADGPCSPLPRSRARLLGAVASAELGTGEVDLFADPA